MTKKKTAKETITAALERSRRGYIANVACLLYDNQRITESPPRENLKKTDGAERMAERIVRLLFD